MRTIRQIALASVALLTVVASSAAAQNSDTGVQAYRFTVQGYLANYWLDRGGDQDRASVGGYGARVMFNRSTPAAVARTFFSRSSVGAYATLTAKQDETTTQNLGVQLDVPLFPMAIASGRLDPFVSLGAGVIRSKVDQQRGGSISSTDFTVIPAAGTKIPFFNGIGFRGDLRAPIVFSDGDTRLNFLAEGGFYVSF